MAKEKWVAATEIVHGDDQGEVTFAPGDTVDKSRFTDEQWNDLLEAGALTDDAESGGGGEPLVGEKASDTKTAPPKA